MHYKINLSNTVWGRVNGRFLIVRILELSPEVYVLTGIGLGIWRLLLKNYSRKKIILSIRKKYPGSENKIINDVDRFIKRMERKNIIHEIR